MSHVESSLMTFDFELAKRAAEEHPYLLPQQPVVVNFLMRLQVKRVLGALFAR